MIALVQRVARRGSKSTAPDRRRHRRRLAGVGLRRAADTAGHAQRLVAKLLTLRIFSDDAGKMNRSVRDMGGGLLFVSQFTLAADTSRGNRPGFSAAAPPDLGRQLFEPCSPSPGSSMRRWPRACSAPTCRCTWSTTGR